MSQLDPRLSSLYGVKKYTIQFNEDPPGLWVGDNRVLILDDDEAATLKPLNDAQRRTWLFQHLDPDRLRRFRDATGL